jgi:hypothetical protein
VIAMTLPRGVPEHIGKAAGLTLMVRKRDPAELRGETHTTVPIQRGREPAQYPRRRRRPRDNYSLGKRGLEPDIIVKGTNVRARAIAALAKAFPGRPWHTVGDTFVVEGKGARARVLAALAAIGTVKSQNKEHNQ